jgi:hypothetical protein
MPERGNAAQSQNGRNTIAVNTLREKNAYGRGFTSTAMAAPVLRL